MNDTNSITYNNATDSIDTIHDAQNDTENDTDNDCVSVDELAKLVGEMRSDFLSLVELVEALNKKIKIEIDEKNRIKEELDNLRDIVNSLLKKDNNNNNTKLPNDNDNDTVSNNSSTSDKTIKYTNIPIFTQKTPINKDTIYTDSRINKNIRGNIYKIRKRQV